ncbi:MAG: oligosaccharide repeat unit polymerase, partial [Clostridium sp.]|nr:oligosaccharide repeat unit polymerase [Clostridium sp.]
NGRREEVPEKIPAQEEVPEEGRWHNFGIFLPIAGLSSVVLLAFVFEVLTLGYIPFFVRGVPHAYASFHVKGVHYFTVSAVLLPSMTLIWFFTEKRRNLSRDIPVACAAALGFLVPVLCASRSQMMFSILLTVLVYMRMAGKQVSRARIGAALFICALLFLVLTVVRGHDAAYLNAVFEMKNAHMPVFFSQPYMYIINNYENFNFLTQHLQHHTMGAKGLFPLWTFTGLKNHYWFLTCWGNLYVKAELTTTTIIYDAWYDFGLPGVMAFSAALAAASARVERAVGVSRNPFVFLLYGQLALYLLLSFFTAWFSLPITWFYFGVTGIAMAMAAADREGVTLLRKRFRRKKN